MLKTPRSMFNGKSFVKRLQSGVLLGMLGACGVFPMIEDGQELSADGLKLLSSQLSDGNDSRSYLQTSYTIGTTSRLLIRREDLLGRRESLLVDDTHPVLVKVRTVSSETRAAAVNDLRLCPLVKNWMMLATWTEAHPFRGGAWTQAGGDFEISACLSGVADSDALEDRRIVFDVTNHVETYLVGQKISYGWILLNESDDVVIDGDKNSLKAPQIVWTETR
jgi:hypothetical protein